MKIQHLTVLILTTLICGIISLPILSSVAKDRSGEDIYKSDCASCHSNGLDGSLSPILYGQEKRYIIQTLNDFKLDKRTDRLRGVMNRIAKNLSPEEIIKVSNYLAVSDICDIEEEINTKSPGWIEKFRAGSQLVEAKNCLHCHGSFHHAAPRLYGQKKSYILQSIKAFQKDKRPGFFKMINIAKTLSDDEAEKIAHYLHGMKLMRDCSNAKSVH